MSAHGHPAPKTVPPPEAVRPAPVPAEPRRRHYRLGLLAILLVPVLAAAYFLRPRPQQGGASAAAASVRTAKAALGTLIRTVRLTGQSSARNFALMSIPVFRGPDQRGNLTLVKLAKGGSMVKKGDLVAELDVQTAQDHIDDTRDTVAQSEQDILKRRAEQAVDWGNLQQTLRVARSDLEKARLEHRTAEVKTDVERELLRLNLDEAEATYKQREADVAATRQGDQAEIRILEITRDRNQAHLNRHLVDIVKFEMKAPMNGLVVMQQIFRGSEMALIQEGDQVSPGQPIMKIVDPSSMQVEAAVNQSESSQFRIGQPATIGLDAFPDLRFRAHVYSMGALAVRGGRESLYVRSVPVRVAIDGSDPRLIPDLSAWADVEIERLDNALLIPREAALVEGGNTVAYVRGPGGFERRPITLGLGNSRQVVVLAGLTAGDEVALARP